MNHRLEKADAIFVLGSHDLRVAERAVELYRANWAPKIIFSGGLGNLTKTKWTEPEADIFSRLALNAGVPTDDILVENESTNTGENVTFTRQLLRGLRLDLKKVIAVQKPYMERRTYATIRKQWPEMELIVTSPQLSFEAYPTTEISLSDVIHIMVGDLQRIKLYAEKGYQIYQEIPDEVWAANEHLIRLGYDQHLIG